MLKNYTIIKELGKGTYGVVYKAKKNNDNNIYVIKQISLEGLNQSQKNEVKLESKILKSIQSKYVVKYYESFEEDNKLNIVMEFCECGDLNEFIEMQKKSKHLLKEDIIWKFFIKITLGLADIHKLKILHRDLKSLNIFLKQENDVRVGDLGVAKVLNNTFFAKTFIGTPYYLSPEICEDKPYNDKSDVWALGCILYELCTYKHPFTARSQGGLILKILNSYPDPIYHGYSEELKNLINIIFDKDFEKRPSCLDILKMKFVIEKAKHLGIYNDIKSSFPDIEMNPIKDKSNNKIINNKINIVHIKPIIKDNNNNNINNKKRPASGWGIGGRVGFKYNNIKFNNIRHDNRKKNDNFGIVNIPSKNQDDFLPKKNKSYFSKDKIINKSNNINNINKNKVRKKVIVSQMGQKEKDVPSENTKRLFKEKSNINKFKNNYINIKEIKCNHNNNHNNDKPTPLFHKESSNKLLNNKDLNNNKKEFQISNEEKNKDISKINNNESKEKKEQKEQKEIIKFNFNYTRDSNYSKNSDIIDNKNIDNATILNKDLEKPKENKDNKDENNFSIESDIYLTAKRDIYQPNNAKKEVEDKKADINTLYDNNFNIEGNSPLSKEKEKDVNEQKSELEATKNSSNFNFTIITNNDEFKIEDNNGGNKEKNIIDRNLDNNKSISSEDEMDNTNKCLSENDKSNEDSDNDNENDKENVVEIDEKNDIWGDNATIKTNINEDKKKNLRKELKEQKEKLDKLKEAITKLIGQENYKYIMELCSIGVRDISKQEEMNDKIMQFINDNCVKGNEGQMYDILQLFILECQYYKKQEQLSKL